MNARQNNQDAILEATYGLLGPRSDCEAGSSYAVPTCTKRCTPTAWLASNTCTVPDTLTSTACSIGRNGSVTPAAARCKTCDGRTRSNTASTASRCVISTASAVTPWGNVASDA